MDVVAWITGIILIAGFGMAGLAKITGQPMLMEAATHLGFTANHFKLIGAAEVAGAAGVLVGLLSEDLEWLGALAALGLAAMGLGAFFFHRKAGDGPKDSGPALVLAAVAVVHVIALASA